MQERQIHQVFEVSVLLKAAHAVIECIGGIALAFTSTGSIRHLIERATQNELLEDQRDFVATHLLAWAEGFSVRAQHFYAWYLLSHGAVLLALAAGLLMRKLSAYPAMIAVLVLFIVYQLYRYTHTPGLGLLLLTLLDVAVVGLTWHEYMLIRRHLPLD